MSATHEFGQRELCSQQPISTRQERSSGERAESAVYLPLLLSIYIHARRNECRAWIFFWLDTFLARDNRFLHDAAWLGSSVRLGRWTAALVARSVHGWPRVLSCTASCGRTASTKVSAGVRARCAGARRAISLWLRDDPSCPSPTRCRKSLALAGFSCRPA